MKAVVYAFLFLVCLAAPSCVNSRAAGTWRVDGRPWTIALEVEGATLTGTVDQDRDGVDAAVIFDGKTDGETITFKAKSAQGDRTITFIGVVRGDEIAFTRAVQVHEGGSSIGSGVFGAMGPPQFTARRIADTAERPRPAAAGPAIISRPASLVGEGAASLPRFERALLLEDTSEESANVSIGDLDGDGHLDIVLAKGRHTPLVDRVLVNDGSGRFPTTRDLGQASDRSYSASLADIDADGDLDVVVSNDTPDPKFVYLNDGTGTFRVGSTYGRSEWPTRNASVADLDNDGLPDIIVANRTGSSGGFNFVCLNRGSGRFESDCVGFSEASATTITPADFNGDGFVDLAVPHRDGGQSYIHLNDGEAAFSTRIPFGSPEAAIRMVAAADLNGDALIDLVSIDETRGTLIYFNEGNGTFAAGSRLSDNTNIPYALAVGDLNLDRGIDIVVGHVNAQPTVFFNHGSGRSFVSVPFGDALGTAYGFAFGDLDEDGVPDIAVARSGAPNVVYFGEARKP